MRLMRLFEGNCIRGKPGLYPLTAENLLRVGLALCTYMKLHKQMEKPEMSVESLNFLTLSVSVGFMAGGGNVLVKKDGKLLLKDEMLGDEAVLRIEGMEDYELRMVESILFSRYNMPRAEGAEVGNIWIPENRP